MPNVTKEQKEFISNLYLKEGKNAGEIIVAFEAKYGYSPSNKVINKWKYFEETPAEEEEPGKAGKTGEVIPKTGDTRTIKDEVVTFTADEMADAPFLLMCTTHGKSQAEMARLLKKAAGLGYTKVNPVSGEFTK